MLIRDLHTHWMFKQYESDRSPTEALNAEGWLPAVVPGTVHQDLLAAGQIPDPFLASNEQAVQWVGERSWVYRLDFDVTPEWIAPPYVDLCFDGLDTIASVWLNDTLILESTNMFVAHRVPVKDVVKAGRNTLIVLFKSALAYGKAEEAQYGARDAWNGDTSRLYVRKAQYHYGWDWGPVVMTCGIWRSVRLESFYARINEVNLPVTVADDLNSAQIAVNVLVETAQPGDSIELTLIDPDEHELDVTEVAIEGDSASHTFDVSSPILWFPNGYGEQPRYLVRAMLIRDGRVLDRTETPFGIRKLKLVQAPVAGEAGTSFTFEINNVPIFAGGANWIPSDLLVPRLSDDVYRQWIAAAANANMVMLRVWGGGIYEQDIFYDLCDEYGIMVWQDFMFACGMYPAHMEFQASVRAEAESNVRRLRNHPSLVIWCGNNEDYQIAQMMGAYDDDFNGDFTQTTFPGRELYEVLLPTVCAELDPTRPYWPGSPYGGISVFDGTIGDRHTWEVWHGDAAPYQQYGTYAGRFVSEFGMQSYPSRTALGDFDAQYPPSEAALLQHNKAGIGEERLRRYVTQNLRSGKSFEDYAYATQIVQSEALAYAYRLFRGRWGVDGKRMVSGALVWQLNDCWPVTSWALIDSKLNPKPAYYTVKRALSSLTVDALREGDTAALWVVNSTTSPVRGQVIASIWAVDGSEIDTQSHDVDILANSVTPLGSIRVARNQILSVRLVIGLQTVSRASLFPEPLKDFLLFDPELTLTPLDSDRVQVYSRRPAKAVLLNGWSEDGEAVFSDNLIDVFPDDPQEIEVRGAHAGDVTARSLFDLQ